ncbi:hypothetical protein IU449_16970 [Nocardia higoensis]|uniref:ATPase n=1 Tax=Nocardia higoensis TaxID=228599 RepID=A0ABS0DCL9_9NOCA|nr:hypothetical protein [Nocardia higoensis]MBF6356214.1 hypothetical protein [Nocardia higoensis]
MADYRAEMERIIDRCRREAAALENDLAEINRRTAETSAMLTERSRAAMREFWEEHGETIAAAQAEAEEQERRAAAERAEQERQAAELREYREAMARSSAARRSGEVVVPIDDEDPEGEYYRRESWLI